MGQSVMFCVSDEIRCRILEAVGKASDHQIAVSDVLIWAVSETHYDLKRTMALWATQGLRFDRQKQIWDAAKTAEGLEMLTQQAEGFLEDEAQTIQHRYGPSGKKDVGGINSLFASSEDRGSKLQVAAIKERCQQFGVAQIKSSVLQEEQEKELSPEKEQERQIERPAAAEAKLHCVHPHVRHFITTGYVPDSSPAFNGAFCTLSNTSLANVIDLKQLPTDLLATTDYAETVWLMKNSGCADSYQRPIQWIVTSRGIMGEVQHVVIISPYEAQELLPEITKSKFVHLHLYSPRSNLAFNSLDLLTMYTVPAIKSNWTLPYQLRLQLNLFAGQLYFSSFDDYKSTCEMLSLAWMPPAKGIVVEADGFIRGGYKKEGTANGGLKESPMQFIKMLLTVIRRDCQDIDRTHWGRILAGEMLTSSDFDSGEQREQMTTLSIRLKPEEKLSKTGK